MKSTMVKMMKNSKIIIATTFALVLLITSSISVVFAAPYIAVDDRVDPVTGLSYGDVHQYDWIGDAATWSGGDAPESTKFNAGPAPGRPDLMWTLNTRDDIGTFSAVDCWVGGLVMIRSTKAGVSMIDAIDPVTSDLVWQIPHPGSGAITVISDTQFKLNSGSGANLVWMVYDIATGNFDFNVTGSPPSSGNRLLEDGVLYRLETLNRGTNEEQWRLVGYDISDIENGVPMIWNISSNFGANPSLLCAGDGKIFYSSWGDYYIVAINSKTGEIEWNVDGKTNLRDAIYYDGKLITSGVGTRMTARDGDTGETLWDYNAGVRGYFANTGCAAYGMVFQHCMDIPYGYFGAWNATTGELVWKLPAWYYIGYFSPCIADGKIYVVISDGRGVTNSLAVPEDYTACIDAFTGEIIWKVPFQLGSSGFGGMPRVAQGALWYTSSGPTTLNCVSDITTAPAYAMWRGSTESSGVVVGQSGPSTISYPTWVYTTEGPITGSPVISNGRVYFGSQDNYIYCLDARNGDLIWKYLTDYKVRSTPAVVDGRVYTGADDGSIHCINAVTGVEIWTEDIDGTYNGELEFRFAGQWMMRSSPIIVGNRLYVGALDGKVYCLDTADGSVEWTYQTGFPIGGSAAYSEGVIYIGSVDMNLYALNAATGTKIWDVKVGNSIQYYTGTGITGTPLVVPEDGKVYIQCSSGFSPRMIGYYTANGTIGKFENGTDQVMICAGSTPASSVPVYYKGLIYTVGYWRTQCWNATSGIKLWDYYMGHQTFSSPIIADGIDGPKLYIGDEVGAVHAIDISNTSEPQTLSVFATSGTVPGSPAIWERKMYLGWVDWNMYCFSDAVVEKTAISACLSANAINTAGSVTVVGQLTKPVTLQYTGEMFNPGVPNMPIIVSFSKGSTRIDRTTTTSNTGDFELTYTPTEAGTYSVMAWSEGKDLVTYSYDYAYSNIMSLTVGAPAAEEPSGSGPSGNLITEGIAVEYIYAIVAVIAVVIIALAGYLYLKKGKK